MEFLKVILGEELYKQFETAVNSYNGNEANKDKQIKLANLASGEYVGKGKYDALNELLKGKETELTTANSLIADLKKGTKGNEELQGKISNYETVVVPQLQQKLQEVREQSAVKIGLLAAKCTDVPYVTFKLMEKLKEDKKTLELDDNDNIKGWDDMLSGLKTQLPTHFESASGDDGGYRVLDPNKLEKGDPKEHTPTKEDFLKMSYEERVALKQKNEELYKKLKG